MQQHYGKPRLMQAYYLSTKHNTTVAQYVCGCGFVRGCVHVKCACHLQCKSGGWRHCKQG